MTVLTIIDAGDDGITEPSRELLTFVRSLADDVSAAVLGASGDGLADRVARFGVTALHVVEHELLADYGPDTWAESIVQLIDVLRPDAVLAAGTDRGNEVMAHVAARSDLPMAANCTEIRPGDAWTLTRLRWGGMLLEEARLEAPIKLATMSPHAVEPTGAEAVTSVDVATFRPDLDERLARTTVRDRTTRGEGVTLTTAPVVIAGGRGVGSGEGFGVLEQLADLLGGVVGCSRVATNNGWRPHSDQVGQTGARIAPDLYIACGISGATQHWVGCMDSKNILALNIDRNAPLVTKADYAVIADLHEMLPAIVEEVRRRKAG